MTLELTALGWFKSYLSDRFQFFHINDESSMRTIHFSMKPILLEGSVCLTYLAVLKQNLDFNVICLH